MLVGESLLDLARAGGTRSLFVVGTGKNVGKTVAMRAIAGAAVSRGLLLGLTSTGLDGEAADVIDSAPKPRLFLTPGIIVATARRLIPRHPASEMIESTGWATAAGNVVFARVRRHGFYELAGPPTAAGVRDCVERFAGIGCDQILVDGAVDRIAALAGGEDAIVVCAGAGAARTMDEAVEDVRALAMRLRTPAYDPHAPYLRVEGALTPAIAARFAAEGEVRQIVVRDPTQIAVSGKTLIGVSGRLQLRCERPLHVVAATVASIGPERYFEPRAFARAVARATGLPAFDVYAGTAAA